MLINTVILFLRDALPIFVLLGLVLAQVRISFNMLSTALISGLLLALVFIRQVDSLGSMFEGAGIEISLWLLNVALYFVVLMLGHSLLKTNKAICKPQWLALALIVLIIIAKGSNFLLYFDGYLNQANALQSMFLGILLGAGICLSLAVLLFFFVTALRSRFGWSAPLLMLLIFASGQLINALNLLVQVDLLPTSSVVWDSQWLIDDESEYGHLLNVLIGYVATPSRIQVAIYLAAIVLPWFYYQKLKGFSHFSRGNTL